MQLFNSIIDKNMDSKLNFSYFQKFCTIIMFGSNTRYVEQGRLYYVSNEAEMVSSVQLSEQRILMISQ